jgi:hypothetical protein
MITQRGRVRGVAQRRGDPEDRQEWLSKLRASPCYGAEFYRGVT